MISSPARRALSACVGFLLLAGCGQNAVGFNPAGRSGHVGTAAQLKASPYRVLYSFGQNPKDGINPIGGLVEMQGILYGVTIGGPGSAGSGTVFGVSVSGGETVTCELQGASRPVAGLTAANGTLYGTAQFGGAQGRGVVFTTGPQCRTHVLYNFERGNDGKRPSARLLAWNGTFYGTTEQGGDYDGTAFTVSASGKEHVLHRFQAKNDDGISPTVGLINDRGTLYGTTGSSAGSAEGTVYSLTTGGAEHVIYRFPGHAYDGSHPDSELIDAQGVLYGTTPYGGRYGYGTMYSVTTGGKEQVLHSFGFAEPSGAYPGPLTYANGFFYGTTSEGGKNNLGTIYRVSTTGQVKKLYDFDDEYPNELLYVKGVLYGTTPHGGAHGQGTVFAFTP